MQRRKHAVGDYENRPHRELATIRLVEVVAQVAPATADASPGMDTSALEVLLPSGARMFVHDARAAVSVTGSAVG